PKQGTLLAILFHLAFWHMDLGYFARGLLGSWPQQDAGVVLWSLSVCANDWQTSEQLTRLCTIPEPAMLSGTWDRTPYAMEAKILRPLLWFGLLEHRGEEIPGSRFGQHHFYRKAELFQRLLAFNVQVDRSEGARHFELRPALPRNFTRVMRPRFADSIRASSPSGLREQAGHMTASDFCAARYIFSCQAGAIHTLLGGATVRWLLAARA